MTGYLLTQNYAEGSFVRKGQLLFEIDPRPFQAAVDQAAGTTGASQGATGAGQSRIGAGAGAACERRSESAERRRWTRTATFRWRSSRRSRSRIWTTPSRTINRMKAQVAAAKARWRPRRRRSRPRRRASLPPQAAVETAKVNLGFTKLTSPIDGIAGAATTQVGNLVGSVEQRRHHGVDARSDQGEFHGQRAGISQPDSHATRCSQLQLELVLVRRQRASAEGPLLLRRPPGEPDHRRDSVDRTVPESRQHAAPGPVCEGARRRSASAQARCWFRSDPSPNAGQLLWSRWSIRTTRFASRRSRSATASGRIG